MCAACKVIIDNYGALGSAGASLSTFGEAMCQGMMALLDNHALSPASKQEVMRISEESCDFAEEMRAKQEDWRKRLIAIAAATKD